MQPDIHNLSCEVIILKEPVFYTAGCTKAMEFAESILKKKDLRFAPAPDGSVTHLLLGVPAFEADGSLKGGGRLEDILPLLSPEVTICGGLLNRPELSGCKTLDLLGDPEYVAKNAQITAHCAVRLAMQELPVTLWRCPVLVIGWGRIGKCLARLLKGIGAVVTVAARKETDRAMLTALEYDTVDTCTLGNSLPRFRVIFNTAPEMILSKEDVQQCSEDCLKIDLASRQGIDAPDAIWARGLPGKDTPESSGELIARTLLRLIMKGVRA